MLSDTLYKRDSKGKARSWQMEINGDRHRTITGLVEGKKTVSGWTICEPKNVGRANATTAADQAVAEVAAAVIKKLGGEYYDDIALIDTPKFFKPMCAQKWKDRRSKVDYERPVWVQPKLDGIRCIATKDGMSSRYGKPIISCPHIMEQLFPFFNEFPDAILDGELYNHKLHDEFEEIVSLVKRTKTTPESLAKTRELVQYHIYDNPGMPDVNFDVRYGVMYRQLRDLDMNGASNIFLVDTLVAEDESVVDNCHDTFLDANYEGSMVRLPGPYAHNHCAQLLKRKDFDDAEFEIVRIEEGKGNWAGCAKRLIFRLADGTESAAGMKGKMPYLKTVLEEAADYVGKQASIRYFGLTKNGKPRIATVQALHKTDRM